jgi:hypothetical protein
MYKGRAFLTHNGWDNSENYWGYELRNGNSIIQVFSLGVTSEKLFPSLFCFMLRYNQVACKQAILKEVIL